MDIYSRNCSEIRCSGKTIGLCELHLVEAHDHKKQGKTILKEPRDIRRVPHGKYREEYDRLDYYVSPEEVRFAYETLSEFLSGEHGEFSRRQVTIFGTLSVQLVSI